MPDPALPPSLAAEIADMKRRLAALERSPRLQSSDVMGGRLRVVDPDTGRPQAVIGDVSGAVGTGPHWQDGDLGLVIQDPHTGGDIVAMTRDRGLVRPLLVHGWRTPNAQSSHSGTSWAAQWEGIVDASALAVRVVVAVGSSAGTTGQVRLSAPWTNASAVTTPRTVSGGPEYHVFDWDLGAWGATLGGNAVQILVETRVTSGSGSITCWMPTHLIVTAPEMFFATPEGVSDPTAWGLPPPIPPVTPPEE